jgi:hypothetical protein
MNIKQLSVNFVEEQDRILVRINTTDSEELRLWLTRRLSLGFRPALQKLITDHVLPHEASTAPVSDESTRKMMADFTKDAALQKADFKTPFADKPAALPLGAEPLLVTELNLSPVAQGQLRLGFGAPAPRAFQMTLVPELVHGFLHLLDKAMEASKWNESVVITAQANPAAAEAEAATNADRPKYLN